MFSAVFEIGDDPVSPFACRYMHCIRKHNAHESSISEEEIIYRVSKKYSNCPHSDCNLPKHLMGIRSMSNERTII